MGKQQKLEKTIKTVLKTDELTLLCEWNECGSGYRDMDQYQEHIRDHLRDWLIERQHEGEKVIGNRGGYIAVVNNKFQ